jgi:putative DNA primase/helicase
MDTFEERQRGAIPNDLAALRGVRLVTASESSQGGQLDEAKVKRVTGGDTISARFLYKEFFEFRPAFKIWLAANHRPSVRGTDDGIWRRLHIVPFEQSFIGREDKSLPGALRDEAPGILNWAVQGARAWYEGGLRPPPRVLSETLQCRQETDVIGRFLEECTSSGDNLSVPAGILYQRFLEWCSGNGVLRPMTNARFGREMRERGVQKDRQSSGNVYVGIGLVAKEPTPGGKLW